MTLDSIFGTTSHADAAQLCARALLVFFYGLLLVRCLGRRAFARWTPLDTIVAIVVGSNLSRTLTGNADLFGTLAATTVIMLAHWLMARAAAFSPALSRVVEGGAIRLGASGRLRRTELLRHGISAAALDEALRGAGLQSPEEARLIVLEPNGKMSILKRDHEQGRT